MAKGMSIKDALKVFEERQGVVATEVEKVCTHCPVPYSVVCCAMCVTEGQHAVHSLTGLTCYTRQALCTPLQLVHSLRSAATTAG